MFAPGEWSKFEWTGISRVPRYFFNIVGPALSEDTVGSELADERVVRTEAVRLLSEILEEGATEGWSMEKWRVVVTNSAGTVVLDLPLAPSTVAN